MNLAWILLLAQMSSPAKSRIVTITCQGQPCVTKSEPTDVPAVQVLAASATDYHMRLGSATIIGDDHGYCTYYGVAGGGFCYERRGNRAMFRSWGAKKNFVINYVDDHSIIGDGYLPSPQSTLFMLDWEIRHQ